VAPRTTAPRWDLWRYAAVLPVRADETPVSLGEGLTPMAEAPALARRVGVARLWIKDEGRNPTASFKARGMSAAVTRARALGAAGLVVPTAGNAGAALAAYGAAAGLPVRVYAPRTTPPAILMAIAALHADLHLVDGHIGDAGREARAFAAESGWFDLSTLREPYRVEGDEDDGLRARRAAGMARAPAIVYPTGGGEGDDRHLEGDRRDAPRGDGLPPGGAAAAHGRRAEQRLPRRSCAPTPRARRAPSPGRTPETYASGTPRPGPTRRPAAASARCARAPARRRDRRRRDARRHARHGGGRRASTRRPRAGARSRP
jgi:threonine synthase